MRKLFNQTKFLSAQTLTELAVFGAIIIFIIGAIIRQSFSYSYSQNQELKAMRLAMSQSYKYSEGLKGPKRSGDASRNNASVIIIEDRLTSDSAKYGSLNRMPLISQGSATHSRNLFLPVESCEHYSLPAVDFYINGVYVALSTAKFVIVNMADDKHPEYDGDCKCRKIYEKIPNHSAFDFQPTNADRFDLGRSGIGVMDEVKSDLIPLDQFRRQFMWQWKEIKAIRGAVQEGDLFDVDSDLKEEQIVKVYYDDDRNISSIMVRDDQEGDLDYTLTSSDYRCTDPTKDPCQKPMGLTSNTNLYAFTKDPNNPDTPGTYFRVEEGKLYNSENQMVRSVSRKDTIDLISREIRLANDNGIFCKDGEPIDYANPSGDPVISAQIKEKTGFFRGMQTNPVEACGDCNGANFDKTCFELTSETITRVVHKEGASSDNKVTYQVPKLYIRSRVQDRRGRKWITNIQEDDYVEFRR